MPTLFCGLEIWFQVDPKERGNGVATQAAAILVDHLFSAQPHQRVQATAVVGNEASFRVRQTMFLRGQYTDLHLYAIVRGDWKGESDYRTRFNFLESQ